MLVTDTRFRVHETVRALFARYPNGQIALQRVTETQEPWLTATSAIGAPVPAGCVAIKDWSENEGVPAILLASSVIEGAPVARVRSGCVAVPIYRLTAAAREAAEAAAVDARS